MNANATVTHARWFRITRGVALELVPLLAPLAGWGVIVATIVLHDAGAPRAVVVLGSIAGGCLLLGFLATGLGWFAEGRMGAGLAALFLRGFFAVRLVFAFFTGFLQGVDCGSSCVDAWVAPGFVLGYVAAFGIPIISALWLAITIAREPPDPSHGDADLHFAAEGA